MFMRPLISSRTCILLGTGHAPILLALGIFNGSLRAAWSSILSCSDSFSGSVRFFRMTPL